MIKITLLNHGNLEIDNVDIPLNWNINNITDISNRNGSFSKTIKIKGTATNNSILQNAFEVNAVWLTFNPLIKEPVVVSIDGVPIFQGIFQLVRVYRDYSTADSVVYYDIFVKNSSSDFFNIVDSRYLSDIDLSPLTHRWTLPLVEQNMREGNYLNGYQYWLGQNPLTNYPINSQSYIDIYSPRDLKPAIYVKTILDAIFNDAGYYYEFPEFFDINFDKLIIPFNGESIPTILEGPEFRAGRVGLGGNQQPVQAILRPGIGPQSLTPPSQFPSNAGLPIFQSTAACGFQVPFSWNGCNGESTCVPFGSINSWLPWQLLGGQTQQDFVEFNDDTTSALDFYDPFNSFDPITSIYTISPATENMYFESKMRVIPIVNFENSCYGVIPHPDGTGPFGSNPWQVNNPIVGNSKANSSRGVYMMTAEQLQTNIDFTNNTVITWSLDLVLHAVDINGDPVGIPIAQQNFWQGEITADGAVGLRPDGTIDFQDGFGLNDPFFFTNSEGVLAEISGLYSKSTYPTAVGVRVFLKSELTKNTPGAWYGFWCRLDENQFMPFGSGGAGVNPPFTPANARFSFEIVETTPAAYFKNDATDDIVEGALIDPSKALPLEVKQSDFLIGLARLFNLYIYDDSSKPRTIVIKTRDRFYEDGVELDWTSKIDRKSIEMELLSHKLEKINTFMYEDDSNDEVLTAYSEKTQTSFGELKYIFKNEFIVDEKEIIPIFSATPLILQYKKNVPYINARNPNNNIRILSVGDLFEDGGGFWFYKRVFDALPQDTNIFAQKYWRHVGHLYPNSFEPKEDLNYGIAQFYPHNFNTITDNNLFNRFWRKQYSIFETGHMLTANFKIEPEDLERISDLFAARIYIHDSWWNINRIIDYNPTRGGLTRVELITADSDAPPFVANNNVFIRRRRDVKGFNQFAKMAGDASTGDFSGKFDGGNMNDLTTSRTILTLGDNNKASSNNSLIVGSNNTIEGPNIVAIGVNGAKINASGVHIGRAIQAVNIISAGRDEVLSPFGDTNILKVDAGRDTVLPLGSATITQIIKAE